VLTAGLAAFAGFEEWGQKGEPFLTAPQEIVGRQGIG